MSQRIFASFVLQPGISECYCLLNNRSPLRHTLPALRQGEPELQLKMRFISEGLTDQSAIGMAR